MRLPLHLLSHRRWPWIVAALAFILTLPALTTGIALDDWLQRSRFLGVPPVEKMAHPVMDLFVFVPPGGTYAQTVSEMLVWWKSPDLQISFLRPLSAATQLADWRLWPDIYWLHHLHSLAWFALAIAAVAWTYKQVSSVPAVAGLAALLFAVEDAHALPAAWLANRNAVIALLFGALAVGSHVRWRKGDGTRWGIAACVALVLGLFSGESALAAVGYLVAWEVFGANESKLRRGLALLPSAVVVVAWRVAYVRLGYRTWGSGLYIDPGRQPLEFLREAPARGLALIVSQWTQLQCDLYLAMPRALQLGLAAIGLCVVALLGGLFWKLLRTEREARFWAAGSVLSLIPACATFPMDRLLTFSGIGAFGLLAMQVSELGWLGSPSALPQAKQAVRWATGALVVLHLVLAAPLLCLRSLAPRLLSAIVDKSVRYVPENAPIREETWVVVNGFDIFLAYTPLIRGGMGMTVPKATEMMASMMADLEISRPDENTLVVRPDGGWLQYDLERLVCARSTSFAPGQRIRRKTMVVEILEVTSDRRPAAVAFHFEVPLEDPSIRWIQSKGLGGAPFSPPKVGERVRLAAAIPSWKL